MSHSNAGWMLHRRTCRGLLLIVFALAAGCGSIPNDPDDVETTDLVGSWTTSDSQGLLSTLTFYGEDAPAPVTSPIETPLSYRWRFEARDGAPVEVLYGEYAIIRDTQLRLTVEWTANEANTLVRAIPIGVDNLSFTLSADTLVLNETTFIRQTP